MKLVHRQLGPWYANACFVSGIVLFLLTGGLWLSWRQDNEVLRRQALAVIGTMKRRADVIVALNHWVYRNQGFAKNHNYFLVKALGATPIQILHSGGDCADKSRLLSVMLWELGIPSGLVMIYPCADCTPIHTVVEATSEEGRMVVDPIWNIDYPIGDGRYGGVRDLAGTDLGRVRLHKMQQESSPHSKIRAMPDSEATFDYVKAINWDKTPETKLMAAILRSLAAAPDTMLRPRFLEDPKLSMLVVLFPISGGLLIAGALIWLVGGRYSDSHGRVLN